ncbi:unnamed protein product [Urochloa humidicola]
MFDSILDAYGGRACLIQSALGKKQPFAARRGCRGLTCSVFVPPSGLRSKSSCLLCDARCLRLCEARRGPNAPATLAVRGACRSPASCDACHLRGESWPRTPAMLAVSKASLGPAPCGARRAPPPWAAHLPGTPAAGPREGEERRAREG